MVLGIGFSNVSTQRLAEVMLRLALRAKLHESATNANSARATFWDPEPYTCLAAITSRFGPFSSW